MNEIKNDPNESYSSNLLFFILLKEIYSHLTTIVSVFRLHQVLCENIY